MDTSEIHSLDQVALITAAARGIGLAGFTDHFPLVVLVACSVSM